MNKCFNCPLFASEKPCPSADWPSYCDHVNRENGQGYWTSRLLKEAGQPPRKSNFCDPDEPLVERPRPANLEKELVVAHYKEWIDWVNDCPMNVCLYQKCPGLCTTEFKDHVVVRHLPNRGREAGTYLDHIVDNYGSLAEWTYMVQGQTHSGVELFGRITTPFTDTTGLTKHYTAEWPGPEVTDHDLVEQHGEYEVRYGDARYAGALSPESNEPWLEVIWKTWFSSPQPRIGDWYYAFGAEWAVPRHRILARPLSFWKRARDAANASQNDLNIWLQDVASGWAWELIWKYLFGDADKYKVRIPTDAELARRVELPKSVMVSTQTTIPKSGGCGCSSSGAGAALAARNKARKKK